MRRMILLLIFNFIFYIINCNATIHYVKHGQGNVPPYLTWGNAADSIQSAINVCSPGDTVLVANGIYSESLVANISISLIGSSMDSTVIDGIGLSLITINFTKPGRIENFKIIGEGAYIPNAYGISASDYIVIKNCRITQTTLGIFILQSSSVIKNIIMDSLYRGYDSGCYPDTCNDSHVTNCIINLNHENSMGIHLDIGDDYTITNNIILFTGTRHVNELGIYSGLPKKIYIYNNLISGFNSNIFIGGVVDTVFIKNNVLNYGLGISSSIYNTRAINNIFSRGYGIDGSSYTISDYNIYWKNTHNLHNVSYGDSDMVKDPMFVKDTLPNPNLDFDYHLQAFSPGIDKGDPSIKDVDGTRSDIGMFGGPYGQSYTYQDLAPKPPVNLSAVVDTNGVHLKWNKNTEADTAYYIVYMDTVPNFIIDSTKIIGSPSDTFFTDIISKELTHLYYKITAVDKQGNQSGPSDEVSVMITGIKEYPFVINDYKLYQNFPNPFNPTTKIGYRLKESGYVKLMVYDVLGKLVKVLVNKYQPAGYYEVEFGEQVGSKQYAVSNTLASGIYIYRIEVIGKGNIPVYTDMKKMILVK